MYILLEEHYISLNGGVFTGDRRDRILLFNKKKYIDLLKENNPDDLYWFLDTLSGTPAYLSKHQLNLYRKYDLEKG